MTSSLFSDFTQRRFVFSYYRFGTAYRSDLKGSWAWSFKMIPIDCPETSAANYQSTLFNTLEELRSQGKHIFLYPLYISPFIYFSLCLNFIASTEQLRLSCNYSGIPKVPGLSLGRDIRYFGWGSLRFSSESPHKWWNSNSTWAATDIFYAICNSLFTHNPTTRRSTVWAAGSVVKLITNQ
jgi:hypothetical protein